MPKQIAPFLMFQGGSAEEAMTFYTSLFDDGRVLDVTCAAASAGSTTGSASPGS